MVKRAEYHWRGKGEERWDGTIAAHHRSGRKESVLERNERRGGGG
jgi:hypothetical protein